MTGFNGCSSYCENLVFPQLDLLFGLGFLFQFSLVSPVWNSLLQCWSRPKKQLRSTEPPFGWLTSSMQPAKEALYGRLAGQFAISTVVSWIVSLSKRSMRQQFAMWMVLVSNDGKDPVNWRGPRPFVVNKDGNFWFLYVFLLGVSQII